MEYLKHVKINEKDIEDLRLKLNSTRNLRKTMMKVPETDIREMFPFFLACPALVSVSFLMVLNQNSQTKLLSAYFIEFSRFLLIMRKNTGSTTPVTSFWKSGRSMEKLLEKFVTPSTIAQVILLILMK